MKFNGTKSVFRFSWDLDEVLVQLLICIHILLLGNHFPWLARNLASTKTIGFIPVTYMQFVFYTWSSLFNISNIVTIFSLPHTFPCSPIWRQTLPFHNKYVDYVKTTTHSAENTLVWTNTHTRTHHSKLNENWINVQKTFSPKR